MRALGRTPLLLLVACLAIPARAAAEELLVFAAASLTDALREISGAYQATSGDKVVFSFGGSNDLARQIREGAPADVFFSADKARMDDLEQAGLVAHGARRDLLSNTLVVIVPKDAASVPVRPRDLEKLGRIALANPESVPAGTYARSYLQSRGVWDAVKDHVVPTLDVRAALAAVESGHADAGIVYKTDAAGSTRVRVAFVVPRQEGPPIVYPVAPLAASRKKGTAALVAHLAGAEAARVFERFGFVVLSGN